MSNDSVDVESVHVAPVTSSRDVRLDALRGLAMVLVVLGHSLVRATPIHPGPAAGLVSVAGVGWIAEATATNPLIDVIYSFHIPLFAFVSGMVLSGSRRGFGFNLVKRRFLALMVPYFAWLFLAWFSSGEKSIGGLARYMASGALNPQTPGALWFLYALFMSAVILAAVRSIKDSPAALVVSAIVVGLAGVLPAGPYEHLFGLAEVAWVYPFFSAGILFASVREKFDRSVRWALPLCLLAWAALIPIIAPTLIPGPRWWFPAISAVLPPLGSLPVASVLARGLWAIARVAAALAGVWAVYLAYGLIRGRALGLQAWLGKRSIGIYALHSAFLFSFGEPWGWRHVAILFAVAMAGSVVETVVLERFRWTRVALLGRAA